MSDRDVVIHPVGRFNVRVVPFPHPLYHGVAHDFSRPRHDYEQGTLLEVYDAAHPHTTAGQFICAYAAETIAAMDGTTRLNLHGGVPDWTMSEDETHALITLARAAVA
jgi:hypothetical protein